MTHWRRSPRPLGMALEPMRGQLAPRTILADVQACWRDAVGSAIAEQASPSSERGGVLTVSCAAAVWAQELELMGPVIIQRLNHLLGSERIARLRCVTLPLDLSR